MASASRAAAKDWTGSVMLADASTDVRRSVKAAFSPSVRALAERDWDLASASRSNAVANATLAAVAVRFISSTRAVAVPA